MLTLVSAFLYALLTDRVLLIDHVIDMPDLFYKPFPEVYWLLPLDFSITRQFSSFNQKYVESYGNMLKNNLLDANGEEEVEIPSLQLSDSDDEINDGDFEFDRMHLSVSI
ncbi:putative fucosyltransferase 8 [Abeliophyllum distichum]|uniref:Fucosyltransferase n=1 Tax=Abeliophyllum distichum TaxID=126358 RepID=A0ABD1Q4K1_9LAMI